MITKLNKKERELVDWYKVKFRFDTAKTDTAKTEKDYMNAVKQANDFAALYGKRQEKVLASFQNKNA